MSYQLNLPGPGYSGGDRGHNLRIEYYGALTLSTQDHFERAKRLRSSMQKQDNTSNNHGKPLNRLADRSKQVPQSSSHERIPDNVVENPRTAEEGASPTSCGNSSPVKPLEDTPPPEQDADFASDLVCFVCGRCTRVFWHRKTLEKHEERHAADDRQKAYGLPPLALPYRCEFCPKVWTLRARRDMHQV